MTTHDTETKNLPVMTAQICDTWDAVKQHSTTLKVGELYFGGAGTVIDQSHNFVYRDTCHAM